MFSSDKFENSQLPFRSSLIYTKTCEELVYITRIKKKKFEYKVIDLPPIKYQSFNTTELTVNK